MPHRWRTQARQKPIQKNQINNVKKTRSCAYDVYSVLGWTGGIPYTQTHTQHKA